MESAYDIRRQGTLMVGKYLVGHGELRPEAGVELRTGAPGELSRTTSPTRRLDREP
jgi:hypothetical protein